MEPCLCGAADCRFCGPLQGSTKCEAHGKYECGRCEDFYDEHGVFPEPDDRDNEEYD